MHRFLRAVGFSNINTPGFRQISWRNYGQTRPDKESHPQW